MSFPLGATQVAELVLVGVGALAYLHVVLARSQSARTLWYNSTLYGWTLCWSIFFASVFSSLNLETIAYDRFPGVSMILDLLKGTVLNLQSAFLLHGLSRWTQRGRRIPWFAWYLAPVAIWVIGGVRVMTNPMNSFLVNVEPVVRAYMLIDTLACLAGVWMLTSGMRDLDRSQVSVARPLRKALAVSGPLLALVLWLKITYGFSGVARYHWVLLHDLAHILPAAALVWACYRTESVALSVTRAAWRRAFWFGATFLAYMGCKSLWALSEIDRVSAWTMAGLGWIGTMGPLSMATGRTLAHWLNWGMETESRRLARLETGLWNPDHPEDLMPGLVAEEIGAILACRSFSVGLDDARVRAILGSRVPDADDADIFRPVLMSEAVSRAEIPAWEELGARILLPVSDPEEGFVVVLGQSAKTDALPDSILLRLGSLQATCRGVIESRRNLREVIQAQRKLEEGERLAMLGLMSASAAHEIKNPLSAIRNVASAAIRDAPQGSVLRQDLSVVVGEVDRLDATVRRMLHFARDRGACEDAAETVRLVAGLVAVEGRTKGATVATDLPEGPVGLPISENDLKAVLFNLLQNALHHCLPGTVVEVALSAEGPSLSVSNPGEIPEDFRPMLFRPLASRGGTGLGLYISRSKALAAGGKLEYEPAPGRTTFRLFWENP